VTAGQQLIIPRPPTLLLATSTDNPAPLVETQEVDAVVTASAAVPTARETDDSPAAVQSKLVYRVKSGDTLASIARVFKTTVASLKKWNSLRGNTIRAGERLTIFTTTARVTSATH
jgi:membrane-bound lytic murein transglycosylase D